MLDGRQRDGAGERRASAAVAISDDPSRLAAGGNGGSFDKELDDEIPF